MVNSKVCTFKKNWFNRKRMVYDDLMYGTYPYQICSLFLLSHIYCDFDSSCHLG